MTTERKFYVRTRTDSSGATVSGTGFCYGPFYSMADAQKYVVDNVIDGIRGPGCFAISTQENALERQTND